MTLTVDRPEVQGALAVVTRLWLLCAAVSLLLLGVAGILTAIAPDEVNWVVWLRGAVVAAASLVFMLVTRAAARGSRRAYSRMRWVAILAPIGIVAIIVAPDTGYPLWMKAEQAVIGVLIAIIAVILNRRSMRLAFAVLR